MRADPKLALRPPNAVVGAVFCFFLLVACGLLPDRVMGLDTGWHLAAGRWIWAHGEVPAHDPWSFTAGVAPWYNLSWGFDVAIHLLDRTLGFGGLSALTLLVFAALPAAMAAILLHRGAGLTATLIVSLSLGLMTSEAINVRPQLMSYLLAPAIHLVLTRDREQPWWGHVTLFALFTWIWSNTHGAFLMSFVLLGAFGVESLWHRQWRRAGRLVGMGLVGGLVTLANPLGPELVIGAYRCLGSVLKPHIQEWDPVVVGPGYIPQTVFLVILILSWNLRSSRVPVADRLITLGMLYLGLSSLRHSVLFGLLAAPTVALMLDEALEHVPYAAALRFKEADYLKDATSTAGRVPFTVLGLLAAVSLLLPLSRTALLPGLETYPSAEKSPLAVIDALAEAHPGLKTLNDYNLGGHILYRHPDAIRVFADGRVESAYPRVVMEDYLSMLQDDPGWTHILETYDVEAALLPLKLEAQVAVFEARGWVEVARDERAVAFVRPDMR